MHALLVHCPDKRVSPNRAYLGGGQVDRAPKRAALCCRRRLWGFEGGAVGACLDSQRGAWAPNIGEL